MDAYLLSVMPGSLRAAAKRLDQGKPAQVAAVDANGNTVILMLDANADGIDSLAVLRATLQSA